ncbi:MAG: phosphotransferase [Chloroflexota bacterium]
MAAERVELTREQLEAIAAHAGERLKDARQHAGGRYTLEVPGGDRLSLLVYESPVGAETAHAALDMLSAEVDLPVPQVRASDTSGQLVGAPWLLTSELPGEPLSAVAARIAEGDLYKLGQRLGEAAYRIHRIACARYGALAGPDPAAADDERSYALARVASALEATRRSGQLSAGDAEVVSRWFDEGFHPPGAQAALVCAGLEPDTVLVRRSGNTWAISGLTRWDRAQGWSPPWDHTLLFEAFAGSRYFGLRVGYGNAYDLATQRAYEQVREAALRPYRALLCLEQLAALPPGDRGAARWRALLNGLITFKEGLPEQ